jgi:hypothetical protein
MEMLLLRPRTAELLLPVNCDGAAPRWQRETSSNQRYSKCQEVHACLREPPNHRGSPSIHRMKAQVGPNRTVFPFFYHKSPLLLFLRLPVAHFSSPSFALGTGVQETCLRRLFRAAESQYLLMTSVFVFVHRMSLLTEPHCS